VLAVENAPQLEEISLHHIFDPVLPNESDRDQLAEYFEYDRTKRVGSSISTER